MSASILGLLLAVSSAATTCPIDGLGFADGKVAWNGLAIDTPLPEIEKKLGHALEFPKDPDPFSGRLVRVLVGGHAARLWFHDVEGVPTLSFLNIERTESDPATCWALENLVAAVKTKVPTARYVPSRHEPDVPEEASEHPTYVLDERDDLVVLLKPAHGTIFVGHFSDLD